MRDDVRRLAGWILGVPFFLLPVPLTVDAPDIFGGYGIHLRQGLVLAAVGAVAGGLAVFGRNAWERLQQRSAWPWIRGAVWAFGLLLLAWVLATAASLAGRQLARFLGALPLGLERNHAPDFPHPAVVVGLGVVAARLAVGRSEVGSVVRPLALGMAVLQGGVWLHANRFTTAEVPIAALVGVALALAASWPRLRGEGRLGDGVAWAVVLGGLFAPWLAAMTRLVAPLALLPTAPPVRAMAVGAALCATGWTAWLLRRGLSSLGDGVPGLARGLAWVGRRAPLAIALIVLAVVTSTLVVLTGGLLVELFGLLPPESLRRWEVTDLPHPVVLVWWALVLRLGVGVKTGGDVLRLLGGLSLGFVLLTAGRMAHIAGTPGTSTRSWSLVVGLLVVGLLLLPRLKPEGRGRLALLGVSSLAPLLAAPVVARYLLAIGSGGEVSATVCVALGALLAGFVPFGLARLDVASPISVPHLVVRLPLVGVALILPIYVTVHAGIRPGTFALTVLVLLVAVVLTRRGRFSAMLLPLPVAAWLLFYAGFLQTAVFKLGPGASRCASILEDTSARVLLPRHADGGEYLDVYPYDAVPLPGQDLVLASFKRIDKRGGFLEVIDPNTPTERARTRVIREGSGGPLWPERIVTDPKSGNALVQIIGVGAHGMWELIPGDGVVPIEVARKIPLEYEPGNPAVDPDRRTLAVTYVPNREGGNPLVQVFDLDTLTPTRNTGGATSRMMQMADFVETDRGTGRHYSPTLFDFVRFAVVEVETDLRLGRHRETFHPVIGLAADPETRRLFLTNPLAGVMEVLDLDSLELVQTVPVGTFPRDVAHDPSRKRLYVANYGDGSVVSYSTAGGVLEELARAEVGWLLRGLGVDEGSGRVVAASGCGVFEIAGRDGALPCAARSSCASGARPSQGSSAPR